MIKRKIQHWILYVFELIVRVCTNNQYYVCSCCHHIRKRDGFEICLSRDKCSICVNCYEYYIKYM